MEKLIRKIYNATEVKALEGRSLLVTISTKSPDRSGDIVVPEGVMLDNYLKNPVVAAFHNYNKPAIARATMLEVTENNIVAKVEFPEVGKNPEADVLYEMYTGGFMFAWSIGFISHDAEPIPNGGRKFKKIELLEFSAVLVPDNPEALTMLRSKGVSNDVIDKALADAEIEEVEIEEKEKKETPDPEQKDVAELVNLAFIISDLNWLATAFENNSVRAEVVEKMRQAVTLLMECAQEEAVLGQKTFIQKEGRVLSNANRKLVSECVDVLNKLLEASEKEEKEEDKDLSSQNPSDDFLLKIRDAFRKTDKDVGLALRTINEHFDARKNSKGGDNNG